MESAVKEKRSYHGKNNDKINYLVNYRLQTLKTPP